VTGVPGGPSGLARPTPGPEPAGGFPDPDAVLAGSAWLGEVHGLRDQALQWRRDLGAVRDAAQRRARRLAQPRPHPRTALRAAQVGVAVARASVEVGVAEGLGRAGLRDSGADAVVIARAVRHAFERLGPTYLKLGQLMSCAVGVVPADVIAEFATCRDAAPDDPPATVRRLVEQELGPIESVFAQFDPRPIASASIAQVHRARMRDGREVVVKVRHPGIRRRFEADLSIMAWQALLVERLARLGIVNPAALVELFAVQVCEEMDFRLEALNMCEIGASLEHAGAHFVRCPRPVPGHVSERVLVMEYLEGVAQDDVETIVAGGTDTGALLGLGLASVIESTLVYGVFHGDLHPGNMLVQPPDAFALVDFGIVGRLTEAQRTAVLQLVLSTGGGDVRGQLGALAVFDAFPAGTDLDVVAANIAAHRDVLRNQIDVDPSFGLTDLAEAIAGMLEELNAQGFRLPVQLALFAKNLLYLNAAVETLAPDTDVLTLLTPTLLRFGAITGVVDVDGPAT
jgi:ubiquinone biosynthesis protein